MAIKNTPRLTIFMVALLLISITFGACGGGDGPTAPAGGGGKGASGNIGPAGGTVEVTNVSSPLFGVKVEIPEGALANTRNISINVCITQLPQPASSTMLSEVASLGPEGLAFDVPILLSIPYDDTGIDESTIRIYRYDELGAFWAIETFANIDTDANVVSAYISHFSDYGACGGDEGGPADTGFKLPDDGFSIGSPGDCFGMVEFAQWYSTYLSGSLGGLNTWRPSDHAALIQRVTEKTQMLNAYFSTLYTAPGSAIGDVIRGLSTGRPQVLGVHSQNPIPNVGVAHAFLVRGYEPAQIGDDTWHSFDVYNPDYQYKANDVTKLVFKESKSGLVTCEGYLLNGELQGKPIVEQAAHMSESWIAKIIFESIYKEFTGSDPPNPFAGNYSGTYTGGDYGTWTAVFSTDGTINASISSSEYGNFGGSGTISPTGDFAMTCGGGSGFDFNFTWEGEFTLKNGGCIGSGTWESHSILLNLTGTWLGQRN